MEETFENNINVKEIIEEIRENIAKRNYEEDILSFEDIPGGYYTEYKDFNLDRLQLNISNVNDSWQIPIYRHLPSERGFIGALKIFLKRAIRKVTKFYVIPFVEDQNNFNSNVTNCLNTINAYILKNEISFSKDSDNKKSETVIANNEQNRAEIMKTLNQLKKEQEIISQKIEFLEKRLEPLNHDKI